MPPRIWTTCTIDGCASRHLARSWCRKHYQRWQRHGDPVHVEVERDIGLRFWANVDKRADDQCWPWVGKTLRGYGQILHGGRHTSAHRISYEMHVGPIPTGLTIDHVRARGCLLKSCVNPAHLEAVTSRENTLRSDNAASLNARKTHCKRGHEFTAENTLPRKPRGRNCRTCMRALQRAHYDRTHPGARPKVPRLPL